MSRLKRSLKDRDQIVVMTFRWYKIKLNYFNKRERDIYIYIYIYIFNSFKCKTFNLKEAVG